MAVKIIHYQIEASSTIGFRENQKLVCLFKALEKLISINHKFGALDESVFILENFYQRINLKN